MWEPIQRTIQQHLANLSWVPRTRGPREQEVLQGMERMACWGCGKAPCATYRVIHMGGGCHGGARLPPNRLMSPTFVFA